MAAYNPSANMSGYNYSRPMPSPTPSANSVEQRQRHHAHQQPTSSYDPKRHPPLSQPASRRAAAVMSPTFHIDPERSSSSDNGSLGTPFPFYAPYAAQREPYRDSMTTTHHSSIYPHSSSSYSNTSPPSPASPSEASFPAAPASVVDEGDDDGGESTSIDPHGLHGIHHALIDPDDVSFRLRLLVRNNYFLPPAHSKPVVSPLATPSSGTGTGTLGAPNASSSPTAAKSPSSAFRDMFRPLTKSRAASSPLASSNPNSPNDAASPPAQKTPTQNQRRQPPPLRQTRSQGALVRPSHTRGLTSVSGSATSSRALSVAAGGGAVEKRGRVVVLRECVEDLAVAAKEAEIQMRIQQQHHLSADDTPRRSRTRRPKSSSSKARSAPVDDEVVDPTDAVDLPSYYFPAQPSGVVGLGLGVDASGLSAGVLADQLPPPGSPGFGTTRDDMLWRKALLHQAVGLSMNAIPSPSTGRSPKTSGDGPTTTSAGSSFRGDADSQSGAQSLGQVAAHVFQALPQAVVPAPRGADADPRGPGQPPEEEGRATALPLDAQGGATGQERQRNVVQPIVPGLGLERLRLEGKEAGAGGGGLLDGERPDAVDPKNQKRFPLKQARSTIVGKEGKEVAHELNAGRGRARSVTVPSSVEARAEALAAVAAVAASYARRAPRPPSRHRASPAPQRAETPGVPSQALQPPPRRPSASSSPLSDPTLFPEATIRRTLARPLLSEQYAGGGGGYDTDARTARSSDYYTPLSPSLIVQSPSGAVSRALDREGGGGGGIGPSRSGQSFTSGSYYSDDGDGDGEEQDQDQDAEEMEMGVYVGELRERPSSTFGRGSRSRRASPSNANVVSVKPRRSTPSLTSPPASRPSHDSLGLWRPHAAARRSNESSSNMTHGPARASTADSHTSMYSTAFGRRPRTSESHRASRRGVDVGAPEEMREPGYPRTSDEMIQPIPRELAMTPASGGGPMPSTASDVGLHSLGGVGDFTGPIPRPAKRAQGQNQTIASRRSQHLRPLDLLSATALGPMAMGVRTAPPVEREAALDAPGSFLDFDVPQSATAWRADWADGDGYADLPGRVRLPSNAETIVPARRRDQFAVVPTIQMAEPSPFDPNPNPYLPHPFANADPSRPVTNTPPATHANQSFLSSTLSTLSSLNRLARRGDGNRKSFKQSAAGSGDLLRYAMDPRAKSTPTLSPSSTGLFADEPAPAGRRSNVSASGVGDRSGRVFLRASEDQQAMEWARRQDPEVSRFDGMLVQHIRAERDLLKKVAKGAVRSDSR